MKKFIAIVVILMFLATSITVVSATKNYTMESKSGGEAVTEYFNLCYIESSGNASWWGLAGSDNGCLLHCNIGYVNATIIIKTLQRTLAIKGNFELHICKQHPIKNYLFNISQPFSQICSLSFIGKHTVTMTGTFSSVISLKGIGRGVEVTYYQ